MHMTAKTVFPAPVGRLTTPRRPDFVHSVIAETWWDLGTRGIFKSSGNKL
jgi:hypothetical protein